MTPPVRDKLREAHAHIPQHGRAMSMARLEDSSSLGDCLQRVALAARDLHGGRNPPAWLLGVGLRVESWPDQRYPSASELDSAAGDIPVCLWSFDHHALVINTAAMLAAGIGDHAPDPDRGRIVRDAHGKPTGLMLESAAKLVWSRIPEPSPEQRREQVRSALRDLAAHGFTEIHDLLSPPWLGPLLAELDDARELPLDVLLYPRLEDAPAVAASAPDWSRPAVQLAGAKVFADGTLNSRTAWMLHPYADPLPGLPRGQPMLSPSDLDAALALTHSLGIGLAVHAIGDAAVRAALDAYERCRQGLGREGPSMPGNLPALRIEHAEIIDPADIPRFARLGVVCSVQPCHLLADIEALRRGLPHRLDRVLPLRELIDSGCAPGDLLWFGSDTPIVRPHPQDSILAATRRRRADMRDDQSVAADQAITESQAWAAFALAAGRPRRSTT